jgi:hypothetical protein
VHFLDADSLTGEDRAEIDFFFAYPPRRKVGAGRILKDPPSCSTAQSCEFISFYQGS